MGEGKIVQIGHVRLFGEGKWKNFTSSTSFCFPYQVRDVIARGSQVGGGMRRSRRFEASLP